MTTVVKLSKTERFNRRSGYTLPDCYASSDDMARLRHKDVESMTPVNLLTEETRVNNALAYACENTPVYVPTPDGPRYSIRADEWLLERLGRIRSEASRRRWSK